MIAIKDQEVKIRTLSNWALRVQGRSNQTSGEVPCFLEDLI